MYLLWNSFLKNVIVILSGILYLCTSEYVFFLLFIHLDNYIHRARQRYNKPQSLTTKINLSELSTELRLRPAYKITLSEIESVANGYSSPSNTTRLQGKSSTH